MKPQTHMIYFKDAKGKPSYFFGPFVSDRLAAEFAAELPEPLPTGTKSIYPVSCYTFNEAALAADEILSTR
jgi:hypothetical protein